MALKLTCPQCGQRMTMDFATSRVFCQHCGYVRPDEIAQIEQKVEAVKAQGTHPHVEITHKGEISAAAMAAFETGHDLLYAGRTQEALQSFLRAADLQPDFVDAHLWIAKISDDPAVKRDHLDSVLVYAPNHLEALRLLMVLQGRLTPEQAAQTYHDNDPQVQHVAEPVPAKGTELLCPNCGGDLTLNERAQRVECRFCGYSAPRTNQPANGGDLLALALLERKAQAVKWNVGKRLVQCRQCGAEHTLTAEKMSQRCRFCGSTEVILSDALGSFEQPDGLIPFSLTADEAMACVNKQLRSLGERFLNLFNSNKIERSVIDGVYLPFWVFDVQAKVTETHTVGFQSTELTGLEEQQDVMISGVKSPPPTLTSHLAPYDMARVVPYEPKWLAKYPAQLYSIDFDAASLEARGIVSKTLRAKHDRQLAQLRAQSREDAYHTGEPSEIIQITSQIQSMSFRLILLPVWITTLYEDDGEVRLGVVNAQTGRVALGRASKIKP
jgi:ribosomal protein S27AE